MTDSAMFYVVGTLYPLIVRATYPTLGFPQYAGEVATSEADDAMKAKAAKDAADAMGSPRRLQRLLPRREEVHRRRRPSIADIRLAVSLEFLRAIDYEFPAWAEEYMTAVQDALGDAYAEPVEDVRGFVASVK